ncbi:MULTISPECIES: polymorphic toxin-type HINT domain-containing protein [unclassified Streptomyces]|uniref:polymorphic toxin-type HINT domain-containing protein n=1 Tax=Streptomyces sp. NPDC127532 TaxID=3345399 RepID=UPI00362CA233
MLALALSVPAALTPVAVAADPLGRPGLPAPRVSKVKTVNALGAKEDRERVAKNKAANSRQAAQARSRHATHWPKASTRTEKIDGTPGRATVSVTTPPRAKAKARNAQQAGAATGPATVRVLDQKTSRRAGITGVVFTAAAESPGAAGITIDYEKFADAIGGNWGARLGLVSLPACALTSPQKPQCRTQTPVTHRNNGAAQTVSAQVSLPAVTTADTTASAGVFAVTATSRTAASGAGDYKATPLAASSAWEAGGSSGSFTWSYPVTVPPAAAGPSPSLSLSYDSGSTDGRTSNTNNQGSMAGEGFDLTSSYIERKYGSCEDDGQADKSDQCWKYENASLVLNGKATELVKDDTTGVWHLKNDDASQVTHETGADNSDDGDDIVAGKGDGKGEYWKVVTGDGTTYTFGLNKLPGAGTERTNSVWTVPVFGDDSGEPGYSSGTGYSGRAKTQAWRWNLDLVTDVHGNASTYWYKAESNHYAKNGDKTELASYTRGGYLEEIRYGQRSNTLFTGNPSGKVEFTYKERCTAADCPSLTEDTAEKWPDVPFDAICSADETECLPKGPTFFTRKMLTGINTSVWSTAAEPDADKPVDTYALSYQFLDGGDIGNPSDKTLTLKSLQRTGKNGGTIVVPPVEFGYHMRPNRVDATDNILPLTRPRINTITTETGAITTVTLSDPQCVRGSKMPTAEDDNNLSCYPVYWPVNGGDPQLDWFHKYNVTSVSTSDPAGQNEAVENFYTYENPGWHYNNDPFTPADERTWSNWRGYRKVTTYTGDTAHPQSKTVRQYMQGMHGDKRLDSTATRTATIPGIDIAGLDVSDATDHNQLAGFLRQELTYNGTQPVSVAVNNIWNKETASQQRSYANTKAHFVRTARSYAYTYLPVSNTWRRSYTSHTYDPTYGMVTQTEAVGDQSKTGDETCTRTWYARNPDKGLTSFVSRTRTIGSACLDTAGAVITDDKLNLPANTDSRGDVLSDTAVVYDNPTATGWTASQTPTLGLPTWTGRAKAYPAAAGTSDRHPPVNGGWQKVTKTTYDTATAKLGRPLTVEDAQKNVTSSTYYPAAAGPLTTMVVASPKLTSNGQIHKNYTYIDPARGSITGTTDAAAKDTANAYDALGRITDTWAPNRTKGIDTPTAKYDYNIARGSQPWTSVATLKANGTSYETSYAITDALLRPLQTQTASPLGGRILTDTRYDSRGLAYETYADIYDNLAAPNGTYARASYAHTPALTRTTYDAAARPTNSTFTVFGVDRWSTTTSYTGDSTATTAVKGGNATRTITDVLGRTTETRTYAGTAPNDTAYGATTGTPYTRVKYDYTRDGKQSLITGIDDAKWTYTYDLFGRQIQTTDPDKGTSSTEYTDLDQISLTEDSRKAKLLYKYDELGRKTDLWQTEETPPNQLAHWTYDTLRKGKPDASTRYVGGTTGKAYTKQVTAYDTLGRATSTDVVLPADDPLVTSGAVAATTTFGTDYLLDGTLNNTKEPGVAGLPKEIVEPKYNSLGLTTGLSGTNTYLLGVSYSALGQAEQLTLGAGAKNTYITNKYEPGTGRLTRSHVTDQTHSYMLQDLNFTQDDAGNVLSILDPTTLGGTTKADNQCFTYDGNRRLTEAWTPKTADCATTGRTTANLDGAAPYWTSYTYNDAGQRATETAHAAAGDATTTYGYKTPTGQPHPLVKTTGAKAATYGYDDAGNTTNRPGTQATQTLTWNTEGELTSTTEPAVGTKPALGTSYLYDADGELLIRRATGDGDTVLYLGATEVRLTTKGTTKTVTGTRYYSAAGQNIAVRTSTLGTPGSKISFLAADHHGTSSIATDATTQAVTKRYTTPFGAPRGTNPTTWPDDKAFLGKPTDATTGLTHIGAREYDPGIGQFISVDPLLELGKHQTLNGYSYAGQAPATNSDPTGTCLDPGNGHCQPGNNSGKPDPAFPINTNPAPNTGGTSGGGGGGGGSGGGGGGGGNGGGNGGGGGGVGGWLSSFTDALVEQGREFGTGLIGAVGDEVKNAYNCVTLDGTCTEYVTGKMKEITGVGFAESIIARGSEIADDFIDGRSTEGAAKITFDVVLAAATHKIAKVCHSFLPGTGVLLADGTRKDIEDIEVGDTITTTDVDTGETVKKKVAQTITTEDDKAFTEIYVSVDGGQSSIVATDTHPFWVPDLKKWIQAGDLQAGHLLRTSAGTHVQISEVKHYTQRQRTHDLSIEDVHAYYVLAGATPVLVHNCKLSDRASAIHAAEPDEYVKKNISTVAVVRVDTPRGQVDLIAGSGDGLTPAQMSVPLRQGEMHVPNIPGTHAEQNALLYGKAFGYTPVAGGTSRNVCLRICAPFIRGGGGRMMGNVFPGSGTTTTRQRSFEW